MTAANLQKVVETAERVGCGFVGDLRTFRIVPRSGLMTSVEVLSFPCLQLP